MEAERILINEANLAYQRSNQIKTPCLSDLPTLSLSPIIRLGKKKISWDDD